MSKDLSRLVAFSAILAVLTLSPQTVLAQQCDRACLTGMMTQFISALAAHDPSRLPMADNVRYTEDSRNARLGEGISSEDSLIMFVRPTAPEAPERDDLSFREANAEDGSLYARDIGTDSAFTFASRLSDATRCFLVEEGAHIVHSSWMTTAAAWTREIRRYLSPPEGDGYVYATARFWG